VSSSLDQTLMLWLLNGLTKTIKEYDKLFVVNLEMVEVWLYNNDVDLIQFISIDDIGRPINLLVSREIIEIEWLIKEFAWSSNLQQENID